MRLARAGFWRIGLNVVAGLGLIAVASACGTDLPTPAGGQGAAPTPTYDPNEFNLTPVIPLATKWPQSTPMPMPTSNPDDGVGVSISGTFVNPSSPEQFAQWFDLIVTGTVVQLLPPQWSTADGKRPVGITQQDVMNPYLIFTPAVVKLDGAPLVNRLGADVTSGQIVVATFGGQIGKDAFTTSDPTQHLQTGQHLLFGLSDHPLISGEGHVRYATPAGLSWNLGMVYTLTDDGKVIPPEYGDQPYDQPMDAQAFMAAIVKAAANEP